MLFKTAYIAWKRGTNLFERGNSMILENGYKILLWFMWHFTVHKKKMVFIYAVANLT